MAIVFIDLFFIYNFTVNLILLLTAKMICFSKTKIIKIVIGAFFGAFYSVCHMILNFKGLFAWLIDIAALLGVVVFVFFSHNIKQLIRNSVVFLIVNFIYGGAMFFLIYFLNLGIHFGGGVFYVDIPALVLVLTTAAMFLMVNFVKRVTDRKMLLSKNIYDLEIFVGTKSINVKALYDTGNLLIEPISGAPVILIEENSLISENIDITTFRFIPYKTAGGNGYISAFTPDKIKIDNKKIDVLVYAAIISGILSKDGEYKAILHPLLCLAQ